MSIRPGLIACKAGNAFKVSCAVWCCVWVHIRKQSLQDLARLLSALADIWLLLVIRWHLAGFYSWLFWVQTSQRQPVCLLQISRIQPAQKTMQPAVLFMQLPNPISLPAAGQQTRTSPEKPCQRSKLSCVGPNSFAVQLFATVAIHCTSCLYRRYHAYKLHPCCTVPVQYTTICLPVVGQQTRTSPEKPWSSIC